MVKKMLEVVVNYLYPALTTVKMDWLFLCTPDSVMFATSRPPFPSLSQTSSACRSLLLPLRCGGGNCYSAPPTPLYWLLRPLLLGGPGPFRKQPAIWSRHRPAWLFCACWCGYIKPIQALITASCRICY